MHIKKLIVKNFKKFENRVFEFNDDLNILVGDNDSGKSTILESIEIALNCSYRGKPIYGEIRPELFNLNATNAYLSGDKSIGSLPSISVELFMEDVPDYRGEINSLKENCDGISLVIKLDEDLKLTYAEFAKTAGSITSIPVEFYKIEWMDFSSKKIKYLNRKVNGLFVDPSRLHPSQGRSQYINRIINSSLTKSDQTLLNVNYRQLKQKFDDQPQVKSINSKLDSENIVTSKKLGVIADVSASNFESGLQLSVDDIHLPLVGKGEQNTIQIKLAIQNKSEDVDVILFEEPENHLSHTNLSMLIKYIELQRDKKQLFLTTHSSYVLNKLSISKLCLINDVYTRPHDIDPKVVARIKRLPGYDTLRVVLSQAVILVEGPSDELILKRFYWDKFDCLPEDDGIDIIVVRGTGFKSYLEISKKTGTNVNVLKDNDGDHKKNIEEYSKPYDGFPHIQIFGDSDNKKYSLEPVMIHTNNSSEEDLNAYAKNVLSTKTFNIYETEKDFNCKVTFLINWYLGAGGGSKKVDSAMRIFESESTVRYPDYFERLFSFG